MANLNMETDNYVGCITAEENGFLEAIIKKDCSTLIFSDPIADTKVIVETSRNSLIELRDIINIVLEQSKPIIKIN